MKPGGNVAKGKKLETWIVQWLHNKKLDEQAIRTPGSGSGRFKGDIYTPNLPIILECKNVKTPHISDWIEQAQSQTFGYQPWAVLWHPQGKSMEDTVAIVPLDLFEKLLQKIRT